MTRREYRQRIWRVLQPILDKRAVGNYIGMTAAIHATAIGCGKSAGTVYRWLRMYDQGLLTKEGRKTP